MLRDVGENVLSQNATRLVRVRLRNLVDEVPLRRQRCDRGEVEEFLSSLDFVRLGRDDVEVAKKRRDGA